MGGSQWGSASDGKNVYVAISDMGIGGVADPKSPVGYRLILDGKKGGGQMKPLEQIACNCGAEGLEHRSTCPRGRVIRYRRKKGLPMT